MQPGDVVHFTVFDRRMEFRLARQGTALPAMEAYTSTVTSQSAPMDCPNSAASSSEDRLHLNQVRCMHQSSLLDSWFPRNICIPAPATVCGPQDANTLLGSSVRPMEANPHIPEGRQMQHGLEPSCTGG